MAWEMPFEDLETDDIEKRFNAEEFPDVTRLLAGDIIRDYWAEKSDTTDVEEAMRNFSFSKSLRLIQASVYLFSLYL